MAAIPYDRIASSGTIEILVGSENAKLTIHRELLAALSAPLQALTTKATKTPENRLQLSDVDKETLTRFFEFAYTGDYTPASPVAHCENIPQPEASTIGTEDISISQDSATAEAVPVAQDAPVSSMPNSSRLEVAAAAATPNPLDTSFSRRPGGTSANADEGGVVLDPVHSSSLSKKKAKKKKHGKKSSPISPPLSPPPEGEISGDLTSEVLVSEASAKILNEVSAKEAPVGAVDTDWFEHQPVSTHSPHSLEPEELAHQAPQSTQSLPLAQQFVELGLKYSLPSPDPPHDIDTKRFSYKEFLLSIARVYVLAARWGVEKLMKLSLNKLHESLLAFEAEGLVDIIPLANYCFEAMEEGTKASARLQELVGLYLACKWKRIWKDPACRQALEECNRLKNEVNDRLIDILPD